MLQKLIIISILATLFSSCKKAEPTVPLEEKGEHPTTTSSGTNFNATNKTIIASTYSTINDLIVSNNKLYIVGNFTSLGSANSRGIVSYDGSSLASVPNNLTTGTSIRTAEFYNNSILLGGVIYTSTNSSTSYFGYIYNGMVSTYNSVQGSVYCFKNDGTYCYMGGNITSVNSSAGSCAYLNNNYNLYRYGYSALNSSAPLAYSIEMFNGTLFMGGSFSNVYEKNIVFENGSYWQKSGDGFSNAVYDLEVFGNKLYAAGSMMYDGNYSYNVNYVNSLSSVNGYWSPTGANNLPSPCYSLETHNNQLLAAGNNSTYGYLYRFNSASNSWVDCLTGLTTTLYRLEKIVSFGGKVYGIERNTSTGVTNFIQFN